MPVLSRWYIRFALLYFLSGITLGALLLLHKGIGLHPDLWRWLPVHVELLLVGWIVQLVMGTAFWILPRFWQEPRRPRAELAVIAFFLINSGIFLVVSGLLAEGSRALILTGRLLELLAILVFFDHARRRVVSREGV